MSNENSLFFPSFFSPIPLVDVINKTTEKIVNMTKQIVQENENKHKTELKLTSTEIKSYKATEASKVSFPEFSKAISGNSTKVTHSKNEISGYKIDDQEDTNACGTTSLASIYNYYGHNVSSHWAIDEDIRSTRFDMFTAPKDIINHAKANGFNTGMRNNGDLEEVASYVDKGVPVLTLIDSTPEEAADTGLHWEVVVGYERDNKGKIDQLKIADPSGGKIITEKAEDFKKEWKNLKVGADIPVWGEETVSTGYNNMFIVMTPKNGTVTSPDGTKVKSESIKLPSDSDTFQGKVVEKLAHLAKDADEAVGIAEDVAETSYKAAKGVAKFAFDTSPVGIIYNIFN